MTIEEMKARKAELGYSNEQISELSGVPLGTVQKIFAGETKSPRYNTVRKLIEFFSAQNQRKDLYEYSPAVGNQEVMDSAASYGFKYHAWTAKEGAAQFDDMHLKPPKKTIGIANGKYRMPPDELFFDDEISEMFEDI